MFVHLLRLNILCTHGKRFKQTQFTYANAFVCLTTREVHTRADLIINPIKGKSNKGSGELDREGNGPDSASVRTIAPLGVRAFIFVCALILFPFKVKLPLNNLIYYSNRWVDNNGALSDKIFLCFCTFLCYWCGV